jgi:hypothetical protein
MIDGLDKATGQVRQAVRQRNWLSPAAPSSFVVTKDEQAFIFFFTSKIIL